MKKACTRCGIPIPLGPGTRCDEHAIPQRTGSYGRDARRVVAATTTCGICGEGPRPDDPFVNDHVVPRGLGGADHVSNYQGAHRSCNGRKGQALGQRTDLYPGYPS